jgi:hypothetical protein
MRETRHGAGFLNVLFRGVVTPGFGMKEAAPLFLRYGRGGHPDRNEPRM